MKKLLTSILLFFVISSVNLNNSFASSNYSDRTLNLWEFFQIYFDYFADSNAPCNNVKLNFKWVTEWSSLYNSLQKWYCLWKIKTTSGDIDFNKQITEDYLAFLIKNTYNFDIKYNKWNKLTFSRTLEILKQVNNKNLQYKISNAINDSKLDIEGNYNFWILNDVYLKLSRNHYDSSKFNKNDLLYWAIKWMSEATWDKHTTFFPPSESTSFNDSLNESYQWIGAYVEMEKPWVLTIVSLVSDSPAEKAWLKKWDVILKIDDFILASTTSTNDAVAKIKWPAWTQVKLQIKRWSEILDFSVTRQVVKIENVELKKIKNWDYYLKIRIFAAWVNGSFEKILNTLKSDTNFNWKIIIDLRNNPGGSLEEVANILDKFVPKNSITVNIKTKTWEQNYKSNGTDLYNFSDKKIVILINEWSASASEILAWTIKDYLPDTKLIGEKTYWKWSVQQLNLYENWASFKYTIAKWFTWKTKTWIDWLWIKPDIEIKLNEQDYKNWIDNQLNYAENLNF